MIDIKDEILAGEPKYRIIDNSGNILYDNLTLEQITEVIEEGTPINKANLDEIQGAVDKETVFNENGSITETSANVTTTTVFNADGSITETSVIGTETITKTTIFHENGTIEEAMS